MKNAIRMMLFCSAFVLPSGALADTAALARNCAHCHGLTGTSSGNLIPNIGGQRESYLRHVLIEFKNGTRPSVFMERLAKGYTDQELAAVATYFSRMKWSPGAQTADPLLVERGKELAVERCTSCHGGLGSPGSEAAPLIAGQWAEYLRDELAKFKSPQMPRPDPGMLAAVTGLSSADIEALAHFYASQGQAGAKP